MADSRQFSASGPPSMILLTTRAQGMRAVPVGPIRTTTGAFPGHCGLKNAPVDQTPRGRGCQRTS